MSLLGLKVPLALLAFVAATSAWAGTPQYVDMRMSNSEDGEQMFSFKPDTPKIYLHAGLEDVPSGTKLSSVWIAEDTGGVAPANYKIDSVEITVGSIVNVATFSLSKPTAGWPIGAYRVDVSIGGKPAGTMQFAVEDGK